MNIINYFLSVLFVKCFVFKLFDGGYVIEEYIFLVLVIFMNLLCLFIIFLNVFVIVVVVIK